MALAPAIRMETKRCFQLPEARWHDYTLTISNTTVIPLKQYVTSTPGVCGGKPCISGTRIRVWDVACFAQAGCSPDEIISHYPDLTLAEVHAALAYFYENREAIEARAAADDRYAEELRQQLGSGPLAKKLAEDGLPASP